MDNIPIDNATETDHELHCFSEAYRKLNAHVQELSSEKARMSRLLNERFHVHDVNKEFGDTIERIANHLGFVGTATELADAIEATIPEAALTPDSQS